MSTDFQLGLPWLQLPEVHSPFNSWCPQPPSLPHQSQDLHVFWRIGNWHFYFAMSRQGCWVQIHLTNSLSEPVLGQRPDTGKQGRDISTLM